MLPQLLSQVGFVHLFRPLGDAALRFALAHTWAELGPTFAPDHYTDAEAVAAIARITSGNFRLVHPLFAQIARVLEIDEGRLITKEDVEAAREPDHRAGAVSLLMPPATPECAEETTPCSADKPV